MSGVVYGHGQARFVSLMVEDKTKQGTSYVDQLCQLHRQIQSRMG